ncbi:MAG TPA: hypothetical protein VGK50_09060 [Coriobacteriia bacterium]
METPIAETLLLLSSIVIVPAILVLLFAFFTGRLTADEDRRYLPILEPETDWWDTSDAGARPAAPEGGGGRERA